MEFRLVFDGALPAAGARQARVKEKQAIRRHLHPQLRELWRTHPALQANLENRHVMDDHLAGRYSRCGYRFVPLVNKYFNLTCALDILFLRRDAPGGVVHGGDLDNRIKVLFDGLRLPQTCDELAGDVPGEADDPFFCLLEDDFLVSQFQVTTDRLLVAPRDGEVQSNVHLVIKVATLTQQPGQVGSVP